MELVTGLFIVGLYRATEKIWEKGFDAAWAPVDEALKKRFARWAGRDKEGQRQAAFARAAGVAHANTLRYAADPDAAARILDALDSERDPEGAEALAGEASKLMLFSATPDLPRLTQLCQQRLHWDAVWGEGQPPAAEAVATVLSDFLTNLREALLDQEPYHDLIQREMLRSLREVVNELRPVAYDDEATYRYQVAEMYRQLEFVGIPELKERRPITVEDIFIRLRAERHIEAIPDWELEEQIREATAQRDAHRLIALQAKQRKGSVGRKVTPEERQHWLEELADAIEARDAMAALTFQRRLERTAPFVTEVSITESLKQTDRMAILGDPGTGKTTLLKYLTVICAEGRAEAELGLKADSVGSPLPVFIPLREFAAECARRNQDYCLLDYLYTHAREHLLLNLPRGFFEEALEAGRCLVCLDGLDEVWAVGQRKAVVDAVKALAARFPRNHTVVTSRAVGYEEAPLDRRDFIHHTVLPLGNDDIREFVRKWYAVRERDPVQRKHKADDLIGTIDREPRINSLATNPLLLTIIALVHRIEAELPQERVKLYDKCVTALVDTWEEIKGLTIQEKQRPFYRYRRRLLERLAYELHAGAEEPGQLQMVKAGKLELMLTRFLMENRRLGLAGDPDGARDEAQAFVRLARGRTGLLVERGEGTFGFPHLTFQEYLAACDVENHCIHRGVDAIWEEIEDRLHDPHWQEVILLLLGSLNKYDEPPTLLVERILESSDEDKFEPVLHRHLYLAARALADRVDVADDLHLRVVTAVLRIARTSDRWERGDALTALSRLKQDDATVDGLLALARDPQVGAEVRHEAAAALGQLGHTEQATEILLALSGNPQVDDLVHIEAATGLGQLGHTEEAAEVLLALTHNPQVDARLRAFTVSILKTLANDRETCKVMLALARDDREDEWVRLEAALALGELGCNEEAAEVLLTLAKKPQVNAQVRSEAAFELVGLEHARYTIGILLALACDEQVDAPVRRDSALGLVELGYPAEASEILLSLAHDERIDTKVRHSAASALGYLGRTEETVLDNLLTLARDNLVDSWVRRTAAFGLVGIDMPGERVRDGIMALASDECVDPWVRRASALALEGLDHAEGAGEIILALSRDEQGNDWLRSETVSALLALGCTREAVKTLLTLACDEQADIRVRHDAASALGQLGHTQDKLLEGLLVLACDTRADSLVRSAATSALGQLGRAEEQVLDSLLALARDPQVDDLVRSAAYEGLKRLVTSAERGMAHDK